MSTTTTRAARTVRPAAEGRLALALAAVVLLSAVAIFHVWTRTRVLTAGYELGALQKQHAELQAQNDALHIELSWRTSRKELDKALEGKLSKLGMALPNQGEVLAAGPRRPRDGAGRAGVDGVGDPSGPAGPALSPRPAKVSRRAAGSGDPGRLALNVGGHAGWGPEAPPPARER